MTRDLDQVLIDAREDAARLRLHGHVTQAESIERVVDEVAAVMRPYLDWLTDQEAELVSGRPITWLRARFPQWEALGMAKRDGTGRRARRLYRRIIVPRRANTVAAYEAGRRGVA